MSASPVAPAPRDPPSPTHAGGRVWRAVGLSLPPIFSASALIGLACVIVHVRIALAVPDGRGVWALPPDLLVAFGGNWAPGLRAGEWWRLASAIFLHGGLLHLLFNVLGLSQIGPTVERAFGRGPMLFFYMLTGVLANVGSLLFGLHGVGVGASGALMGLMGVAAGWGQRLGSEQGHEVRNLMLKWAAYTMIFGFAIKADNAAHASGFVVGAALGFAVKPNAIILGPRRALALLLGAIGTLAALAALGFILVRTPGVHDDLDALIPNLDEVVGVSNEVDSPAPSAPPSAPPSTSSGAIP